jgi:DnaK suppressor protein
MATKTSTTKDTAPKAKTAATPEKKGAVKAAKEVVAAKPGKPASDSNTSNTTPAVNPHLQDVAEETKQKAVSKPEVKVVQGESQSVAPVSAAVSANTQDQKWQEIRLILEKLKEDTLREIRKSVKNGTEAVAAIEPGGDIYDQASSERDRELGLLLGDREREKIHSIDEALLRIDDGDYGICEECDEDIPLGRLKAMPFTRHCVKCKSDLEKLQAQTKRVEEERAYREIPIGSEEEE